MREAPRARFRTISQESKLQLLSQAQAQNLPCRFSDSVELESLFSNNLSLLFSLCFSQQYHRDAAQSMQTAIKLGTGSDRPGPATLALPQVSGMCAAGGVFRLPSRKGSAVLPWYCSTLIFICFFHRPSGVCTSALVRLPCRVSKASMRGEGGGFWKIFSAG